MSEEQPNGVLEALNKIPSKPSQEQLDAWKTLHGEVFATGFSPEDMYYFRALTRKELLQLQQLSADPQNNIDNAKFEELICDSCVLWRSIVLSWEKTKAGTVSTLHEQILQNSNFVTPQIAAQLVVKL